MPISHKARDPKSAGRRQLNIVSPVIPGVMIVLFSRIIKLNWLWQHTSYSINRLYIWTLKNHTGVGQTNGLGNCTFFKRCLIIRTTATHTIDVQHNYDNKHGSYICPYQHDVNLINYNIRSPLNWTIVCKSIPYGILQS